MDESNGMELATLRFSFQNSAPSQGSIHLEISSRWTMMESCQEDMLPWIVFSHVELQRWKRTLATAIVSIQIVH